jgi:hypothetical protein
MGEDRETTPDWQKRFGCSRPSSMFHVPFPCLKWRQLKGSGWLACSEAVHMEGRRGWKRGERWAEAESGVGKARVGQVTEYWVHKPITAQRSPTASLALAWNASNPSGGVGGGGAEENKTTSEEKETISRATT